MEIKKYPKYVTTDSDLWNSADEAYFFVVKGKAKPFNCLITPIIENALDSGLLREATSKEIEDYELEENIEKKIRERKIIVGRTREETVENYYKWKKNNEKINKEKIETTDMAIKSSIDSFDEQQDAIKEKLGKSTTTTTGSLPNSTTTNTIPSNSTITTKGPEPPLTKTLTPTENALKQKATIRSDNM